MDTKFQTKHESDMTDKEKRELEREKLASMKGKEKVEYILTYYRMHIAAVVIIILLAVGIGVWIDDLQDETMLYAAIINATDMDTALMDDFRELRKDEDRHHKYILDTSIVLSQQNDSADLDYASKMKLTTLVGANTVDVYICSEELYQLYAEEEGSLVAIADLMGEEFVSAHKDICEENAIRVEDSRVLKQYGYQSEEPAYLIVFHYSKHQDVAADFIDFILQEE